MSLRDAVKSSNIPVVGLIFSFVACLINAIPLALYMPDQIALSGFSPIAWLYKTTFPEKFIGDFPGGIENYEASLFLWIYRLFFKIDVLPETVLPFVIIFEVFFFFAICISFNNCCRHELSTRYFPVSFLSAV